MIVVAIYVRNGIIIVYSRLCGFVVCFILRMRCFISPLVVLFVSIFESIGFSF